MRKKDLICYALILIFVLLFLWQWLSKGTIAIQLNSLAQENYQLHLLSGIGPLRSTHQHADIKVYINGQSIDFSQRKYQVTTSFIHFEEGIGDVIHTHATGLTMGNLFKSIGSDLNSNCLVFDGKSYCSSDGKTLRFYVNGKLNNQFASYALQDLDKILVSYGSENESGMQQQMASVTNLAPKYSANKQQEMD